MTYFKDLDPAQQEAFRELVLRAVDKRIREEMHYTNQVFRLLVFGNGAGVALLATFMGAVAATGNPVGELVTPLWKFFFGSVSAALIYGPLFAVAGQATNHMGEMASKFILNEIEIESMQGYSLNRRGRLVVGFLALVSLLFFAWGVYQSVQILKSL